MKGRNYSSHPVWLDGHRYASKKDLTARLKRFLQAVSDGHVPTGTRQRQLQELLLRHPDADRKIGPGIERIVVKRNPGSGNGFVVVRTNDTCERFDYEKAVSGNRGDPRIGIWEALRFEIQDQVIGFRRRLRFPVPCALSGKPINSVDEMDVDHEPSFKILTEAFLMREGLAFDALTTTGSGPDIRLSDQLIKVHWKEYHRTHATLRPVLKDEHLSKGE